MAQIDNENLVLLLFPSALWNLYCMELRHRRLIVDVYRQGDIVEESEVDSPDVKRIIRLCKSVEASSIYTHVGKKNYKTQKKFFENADSKVRRHVQNLTGRRIAEAVGLAAANGIHIFFRPGPHDFLEPEKELKYVDEPVSLQTLYRKTDGGLDYKLTVEQGLCPSMHKAVVISNEPSLFSIDNRLLHFETGLNGNLLRPFITQKWVHIPARMEGEYFRKMILKIASKIDIDAEGFDVTELYPEGKAFLSFERQVTGTYHFSLAFEYGGKKFQENSQREKSVTLHDEGSDIGFVCIHRNREWEKSIREFVDNEVHLPQSGTLTEMLEWTRANQQKLSENGIEVEQLSNHKYYIGDVRITQDNKLAGDWFQLHIVLHFDDGLALPLVALRPALLSGEKEFQLPTGKWFVIPDEWLAKYTPLMLFGLRSKSSDNISVHRSQKDVLDELHLSDKIAGDGIKVDDTLPKTLNATLRPYQEEGFRWMIGHMNAAAGCCLSDDMGLGKTVQSIAVILKYIETATSKQQSSDEPESENGTEPSLFTQAEMTGRDSVSVHPVLVVAPASVVYNWRNEISRFAPTLKVLTYAGTTTVREKMRKHIVNFDVVLTTYATMRNDIDYLAPMEWGITIFDESQVFKNSGSQTYEAVKRLRCPRRLALSGTPMENNLQELWSLMDVLNPQLLGGRHDFQRNFVHPISENLKSSNTEVLRKLVAPYFLRRTKAEVLDSLPERQDEIVYCDMTPEQSSLYAVEQSRMRNLLLDKSSKASTMNALSAISCLRQISCAPQLVGDDAPSGKLDEVYERLSELRGTNHKVLIFSEYVSLLNLVAKQMDENGWQYTMLTGQTRDREDVIDYFQTTPSCQSFLISLKAGGLGLNLTEADYVFLLDPWWNITAEEQAISRAHRSGQRRSVFVYRFISKDTLEEKILKLQDRKQSLINAVLSFMK